MELTLSSLSIEQETNIKAGDLQHVYRLSGEFCSTDALYLKQTWSDSPYSQQILVDLQAVSKTDLIAVNALAIAHRKHDLQVIMPRSADARHIFHLTKFTSILNILDTVQQSEPAYAY
jgi:anti-anti-sigma regulatory factor